MKHCRDCLNFKRSSIYSFGFCKYEGNIEADATICMNFDDTNWKNEVNKINQCGKRQDSLELQLKDLISVANRLGFRDAAAYLKTIVG